MPTFYVKIEANYPQTVIEEVIEIDAPDIDAATAYVLEGDGYQVSTKTSYGDPEEETVTAVLEIRSA